MSYWMRGYYFPRKKDLDKWYCSWYSDNEVECRTAPRNRRFKRQNAAHVMSGRGRMQMPRRFFRGKCRNPETFARGKCSTRQLLRLR